MLVTLPVRATQNNQNQPADSTGVQVVDTAPATKVIDGVTYEMVYVTAEYNSIKSVQAGDTGNYYYQMTTDLDMSATQTGKDRRAFLYGNAVIWDLNGYTLTVNGLDNSTGMYSYLAPTCQTFTLCDTSADHAGKISSLRDVFLYGGYNGYYPETITIAGGKVEGSGVIKLMTNTINLVFTGGDLPAIEYMTVAGGNFPAREYVAPYLTATYDDNGQVASVKGYPDDDLQYQVIFLDGDYARNYAKLAVQNDSGNYLYIMTADWDLSADATTGQRTPKLYGDHVILDLQGHTLTTGGWSATASSYLILQCNTFEVRDSSATHTGVIAGKGSFNAPTATQPQKVTYAGGTGYIYIGAFSDVGAEPEVVVTGGDYHNIHVPKKQKLSVAPYLCTTCDQNGDLTAVKPYEYYSVSTTELASGAYNHAYALAWEIDVWTLQNLTVPTDNNYYLWARNGEEWYHYLNVRYLDRGEYLSIPYDYTAVVDGQDITFTPGSGWEIFALPLAVERNTEYVLSAQVNAPYYKYFGNYDLENVFFGVTDVMPKNQETLEQADLTVLNYTQIPPKSQGYLSITFNSGNCDVVYLVINAGYMTNDQSAKTFTFNQLCLQTKK